MYNIKLINAQQAKSVNNFSRSAPVLRASSITAWNFGEYVVFMEKSRIIFVVPTDNLLPCPFYGMQLMSI
jgi:hypothetical protein